LGLEPKTYGLKDWGEDFATSCDAKELRQPSPAEVPVLVPSLPNAVSGPDFPPDLARVINSWESLPDAIKAAMLALVDASQLPIL
jgi:hypothetical protein